MEQLEIWKPVSGYEGLYEVSNTGKIRSIRQENKQFGWDGEKADMPDWVTDIDNELPL